MIKKIIAPRALTGASNQRVDGVLQLIYQLHNYIFHQFMFTNWWMDILYMDYLVENRVQVSICCGMLFRFWRIRRFPDHYMKSFTATTVLFFWNAAWVWSGIKHTPPKKSLLWEISIWGRFPSEDDCPPNPSQPQLARVGWSEMRIKLSWSFQEVAWLVDLETSGEWRWWWWVC